MACVLYGNKCHFEAAPQYARLIQQNNLSAAKTVLSTFATSAMTANTDTVFALNELKKEYCVKTKVRALE